MFPTDTEVYGYRLTEGQLQPSSHILKDLGNTKREDLRTIKQVKSWMGLHKTLIRHLPNLAKVMAPFDNATAGRPTKDPFDWDRPGIIASFNAAINHLPKATKMVLPKP